MMALAFSQKRCSSILVSLTVCDGCKEQHKRQGTEPMRQDMIYLLILNSAKAKSNNTRS